MIVSKSVEWEAEYDIYKELSRGVSLFFSGRQCLNAYKKYIYYRSQKLY